MAFGLGATPETMALFGGQTDNAEPIVGTPTFLPNLAPTLPAVPISSGQSSSDLETEINDITRQAGIHAESVMGTQNAGEPGWASRNVLPKLIWVADQLGRGGYATEGAINQVVNEVRNDTLDFEDVPKILDSFWNGLTLDEKKTGTDILRTAGWEPESAGGKVARGFVGFAMDVGTDPLTYLGTFGLTKVGTAAKAGIEGAKMAVGMAAQARAGQLAFLRVGIPFTDIGATLIKGRPVVEAVGNLGQKVLDVEAINRGISLFAKVRPHDWKLDEWDVFNRALQESELLKAEMMRRGGEQIAEIGSELKKARSTGKSPERLKELMSGMVDAAEKRALGAGLPGDAKSAFGKLLGFIDERTAERGAAGRTVMSESEYDAGYFPRVLDERLLAEERKAVDEGGFAPFFREIATSTAADIHRRFPAYIDPATKEAWVKVGDAIIPVGATKAGRTTLRGLAPVTFGQMTDKQIAGEIGSLVRDQASLERAARLYGIEIRRAAVDVPTYHPNIRTLVIPLKGMATQELVDKGGEALGRAVANKAAERAEGAVVQEALARGVRDSLETGLKEIPVRADAGAVGIAIARAIGEKAQRSVWRTIRGGVSKVVAGAESAAPTRPDARLLARFLAENLGERVGGKIGDLTKSGALGPSARVAASVLSDMLTQARRRILAGVDPDAVAVRLSGKMAQLLKPVLGTKAATGLIRKELRAVLSNPAVRTSETLYKDLGGAVSEAVTKYHASEALRAQNVKAGLISKRRLGKLDPAGIARMEQITGRRVYTDTTGRLLVEYAPTMNEVEEAVGTTLFERNVPVALATMNIRHARTMAGEQMFRAVAPMGASRAAPGLVKLPDALLSDLGAPTRTALEGLYFDPKMVRELTKVRQATMGDESVRGLLAGYDKILSALRATTLGVFPAYHTRNFLGNLFNMGLAGMDAVSATAGTIKQFGLFKRMRSAARKGDATLDTMLAKGVISRDEFENLLQMRKHGVLAGAQYGSELEIAKRIGIPTRIGRGVMAAPLYGLEWGAVMENGAKAALYKHFIGKDWKPAEAAFQVKKYLFDYRDLTSFEKRYLNRMAFFYAWTRKNLALQLQSLVQKPGALTAVQHARLEATGGEPITDEEYRHMPNWMKETFPVRVGPVREGRARYATLESFLPIAELGRIPRFKTEVLNLLNPLIKVPLEQGINRSIYFGQEVSKEPIGGDLDWQNVRFLGHDMPARWAHVLRNVRFLSEIDRFTGPMTKEEFESIPEKPDYLLSTGEQIARVLSGFRIYPRDLQRMKQQYQWKMEKSQREIQKAVKQAMYKGHVEEANRLRRILLAVKKEARR